MIDPYKMVFVNVIASCLVLLGIIAYRLLYPKKKINLFILLLFISILPIISIFRAGTYESGDFNIHIYRIMAFYDSLLEGHFMPSWAGELNATYGNPLFIFNYSLPYYFVSLFHFIGASFIASMKIYLALNMYLSGVFMYMFVRKLTNNQLAAFTSAIFYLFNPYHLIDVHFRTTLGESTIFTLVPLLLFFITSYFDNRNLIYLASTALVTQLLFLAHPMIAGIFLIISALFAFLLTSTRKKVKNLILVLISLFVGAVASIYSWISFLIYSSYIFPNPGKSIFQDTFSNIFYSPWRLGLLFQGPNGEMAPIIGYTQVFVVIIIIVILIKGRVSKILRPHFVFWLLVLFSVLFFMSPFSKIIWDSLPFFSMLQSHRLLLPITLSTSVLAGYLALAFFKTKNKKVFIYLLLLITIGYTILNWGHRRLIPEINDSVLRKSVWISTVTEGTTAYFLNNRWADINNFWFSKIPNHHLEIIQGKGTIKEIKRTSTQHNYLVYAQTPIVVKENTLYYPGWNLKSNYNNISIYPGERGIINAKLPNGIQHIELVYEDIFPYKITKIVSVATFITLIILLIYTLLYRRLTGKPQHFSRHL